MTTPSKVRLPGAETREGSRPPVVALPPQAAGQSVQFRWRFAVDTGNFYGGFGWYLDSISVRDGATCCNPLADVQVLASVAPEPVAPGQTLTYSLAVTNVGPGAAYGTSITNSLPASVIFESGSAGCVFTNGAVVCDAGTLPAGNATNFSFAVLATASDPITNAVNLEPSHRTRISPTTVRAWFPP